MLMAPIWEFQNKLVSMARFIELHYKDDNECVLINVDHIAYISRSESGSVIHLTLDDT